MLLINKLTKAGNIKTLVLRNDRVVVTTLDGTKIDFVKVETNGATDSQAHNTLPLPQQQILAEE